MSSCLLQKSAEATPTYFALAPEQGRYISRKSAYMFEESVSKKLKCMRIDPDKYYAFLSCKFGDEADVFNEIIKFFNSQNSVGNHVEFNCFWQSNYSQKPTETELFNYAYELYNNLKRFYEGGVFCLFKYKQAEWGAPEILITEADVPSNNQKDQLKNPQLIYRGLHQEEHESRNYHQSWTTDPVKASEFATETYSDQTNGIVVQASVRNEDIIYYNSSDPEKEVIVKKGVITNATKI